MNAQGQMTFSAFHPHWHSNPLKSIVDDAVSPMDDSAAEPPLKKSDQLPGSPDQKKMDMTNRLTMDSTTSSSAPADPVTDRATGPSTHHLNMNQSLSVSTAPVSHGATSLSEDYLPVLEALSHVDHGVTINDSSPSIVIPEMYPATSCVVITTATWTPTTTQNCPLHTTYGAALTFQPYAACANLN